jgi:hypothetical protein
MRHGGRVVILFFNVPWAWVGSVVGAVLVWLTVGTWLHVRSLPVTLPPNEAAIEYVLSLPVAPPARMTEAMVHPLQDTARGVLDRLRAHGCKPVRTALDEVCSEDLQRCYVVTDLPPMATLAARISPK